jgi:hypothetical protein
MSASSPLNVVGTFLSAGISLSLSAGGKPFCRVARERARCLLAPLDRVSEARPTGAETGTDEAELSIEHCVKSRVRRDAMPDGVNTFPTHDEHLLSMNNRPNSDRSRPRQPREAREGGQKARLDDSGWRFFPRRGLFPRTLHDIRI